MSNETMTDSRALAFFNWLGNSEATIPDCTYAQAYDHIAARLRGEVVVTRDEDGEIVLVSRQDSAGRILSVLAQTTHAGGKSQRAAYTTGHCEQKRKPGGCQLHNLQCGYPACDRKEVQQTPAAVAG